MSEIQYYILLSVLEVLVLCGCCLQQISASVFEGEIEKHQLDPYSPIILVMMAVFLGLRFGWLLLLALFMCYVISVVFCKILSANQCRNLSIMNIFILVPVYFLVFWLAPSQSLAHYG